MSVQNPVVTSLDSPEFVVSEEALVPVNSYPSTQIDIPASKMFVIKKSLDVYRQKFGADAIVFDASQGDGGASLPGVPKPLLERAQQLQLEHGTGYDFGYGTDLFRKKTAEVYWQFAPETGYGPQNIVATDGGRDGLIKAYQAMITLGTGRVGDALLVSRVPWISYNWGPYEVGQNVLLAPGQEDSAWQYTEDALAASVEFSEKHGHRKIAGMVITSPDNPTGNTLPMQRQIELARKGLELGIPFILFDWIYHRVTSGQSADINQVLNAFSVEERKRLIFLDGLTKSLGASNIRNAHLVASEQVCKFVSNRASHSVLPNFYGQAIALAAYEQGFDKAAAPIVGPTNASREIVRKFLKEKGYKHIIGDGGYYAFIHTGPALAHSGLKDSEAFTSYIVENYGIAVIPGIHFSKAGKDWVRFSYALPPEKTEKALVRFDEAFRSL
ncbi:MAG TPA: aminotransferase class I/II-fold pyridoxal phosphate-dependent enzyme [Aggregatilineales bacterium]|nr:aminotransferase class I/II-fold pyridoxal phosphate-dependent enzyme [Aggregatilineales bacterium]